MCFSEIYAKIYQELAKTSFQVMQRFVYISCIFLLKFWVKNHKCGLHTSRYSMPNLLLKHKKLNKIRFTHNHHTLGSLDFSISS